jgi:hypothetical protein
MPPVLPKVQTTGVFELDPADSSKPEAPVSPTPEPAKKQSRPRPKPNPESKTDDDFDLSMYGSGVSKKKNFGRGD